MSGLRSSLYARGSWVTGALLGLALLLAGTVALRARGAARDHRSAVQRLLQDHASYAAAEFTRRAAEALETASKSLEAEGRGLEAYRDAVRSGECACFSTTRGFLLANSVPERWRTLSAWMVTRIRVW